MCHAPAIYVPAIAEQTGFWVCAAARDRRLEPGKCHTEIELCLSFALQSNNKRLRRTTGAVERDRALRWNTTRTRR